jgi:hypothetical protein
MMKYELDLFDKWADEMPSAYNTGDVPAEKVRIQEVFLSMGLSQKKQPLLRRYFRLHREALQAIIRRVTEKPAAKKTKEVESAAQELVSWMDDHLGQYLVTNTAIPDPDDPDIDAQKVITTFTLPELGVIIRLFIEAGVFRVRNQKALTRFMSRNVVVRTKQIPETFSEDHLYNAMHSPAEPAMDKMQKVLNQMLTQLNKLRREQKKRETE